MNPRNPIGEVEYLDYKIVVHEFYFDGNSDQFMFQIIRPNRTYVMGSQYSLLGGYPKLHLGLHRMFSYINRDLYSDDDGNQFIEDVDAIETDSYFKDISYIDEY